MDIEVSSFQRYTEFNLLIFLYHFLFLNVYKCVYIYILSENEDKYKNITISTTMNIIYTQLNHGSKKLVIRHYCYCYHYL